QSDPFRSLILLKLRLLLAIVRFQCSACGGSVTIVSGQWEKRDDLRYGCSVHAYRGDRVCRDNLLISRAAPAGQLFAGLQAKVPHPDAIEYAFLRFEEQIVRSIDRQSVETADSRRQLRVIEGKIRNCTEAIASMGWSTFLRAHFKTSNRSTGNWPTSSRRS